MRALIVDKNMMTRKVTRYDLERNGFKVIESNSGEKLEELVHVNRPDILIMDVQLSEIDILEFCQNLNTGNLQLLDGTLVDCKPPVIITTAENSVEEQKRLFRAGASEVLVKPFATGEIFNAVSRILNQERKLKGSLILVVDDSRTIRQKISAILRSNEAKVIEAEDGTQAYSILMNTQQVKIDAVITDQEMPEMNGDKLCHLIRVKLGMKDLPVIFLTSVTDKDSIKLIFQAGASDYLTKPCVPDELLARLSLHIRERQFKEELSTKIEELKKMNKMKDEFLAIASHDLRSPLTCMLGYAELLQITDYIQETEQEYIGSIISSGNFLLSLINDILDLSRLQMEESNLELEELELLEVIDPCLKTAQHLSDTKGIELRFNNRLDFSPEINGNRNGIIRILNNLLSNAIKFTQQGGAIELILEQNETNTIAISVKDNGIGIDDDKIPHLFERFSKASRQGTAGENSTGLGLAITKQLVEQHKGNITVNSQLGYGTTFTIHLPCL